MRFVNAIYAREADFGFMIGLVEGAADEKFVADALKRAIQQPQDMRAGADRLLAVVVNTLGEARAHHGYLFANARASRLKLLVHDGFGVWCATRRLHAGRFVWCVREPGSAAAALQLSAQQFEALAIGLPWQRLDELGTIRRC